MLLMILKMSGVTGLYVILSAVLYRLTKDKKLTWQYKLIIGIVYGLCSVASTHFGVDYGDMMLNVRDIAPLAAGLFFSPVSGLIAGTIGGVERYIVGEFFGIGSYTRIACSVSTCLAGILAFVLAIKVFKRKKPSPFYAFWLGAVMEVFHMYVVFITHRNDMEMAFKVVKTCAIPMIIFTGIGLAVSAIVLQVMSGEWKNPFVKREGKDIPVSDRFQSHLFIVTMAVILLSFGLSFLLQTQAVVQDGQAVLDSGLYYIDERIKVSGLDSSVEAAGIGEAYKFSIIREDGKIFLGEGRPLTLDSEQTKLVTENADGDYFSGAFFDEEMLCKSERVDQDGVKYFILVMTPESKIYGVRDQQAYESAFSYILLFTVIYVVVSALVRRIVVRNIELINDSLERITSGDLDEHVEVHNSSEFASLSDDINQTVEALKGYIDAAEKRIEQELEFARTIQASALPGNFEFPNRNEFEIFASMDPAKEVGGDFYDFFFVDNDHFALVIADVSGKGIPAALFMMRSKTAIRTYAQTYSLPEDILFHANNTLCEGNDALMFVTAWVAIVNLRTGHVRCANAGHEFPVIKHVDGDYEYLKDKHSPPLASIEDVKPKGYDFTLEPGEEIFVYTDGIPEAIDDKVEQYGSDRLLDVLNRSKGKALTQILAATREDVRVFANGADQFDDITMIGFRYLQNTDD